MFWLKRLQLLTQLLEERKRYVGFFRRKLRTQDRERLIQSVPELYRVVQQDQNRCSMGIREVYSRES
jgi:hypothetical protein